MAKPPISGEDIYYQGKIDEGGTGHPKQLSYTMTPSGKYANVILQVLLKLVMPGVKYWQVLCWSEVAQYKSSIEVQFGYHRRSVKSGV